MIVSNKNILIKNLVLDVYITYNKLSNQIKFLQILLGTNGFKSFVYSNV